jgi:hypothetical protein
MKSNRLPRKGTAIIPAININIPSDHKNLPPIEAADGKQTSGNSFSVVTWYIKFSFPFFYVSKFSQKVLMWLK